MSSLILNIIATCFDKKVNYGLSNCMAVHAYMNLEKLTHHFLKRFLLCATYITANLITTHDWILNWKLLNWQLLNWKLLNWQL